MIAVKNVIVLECDVEDNDYADIHECLKTCCKFINDALQNGGRVLVEVYHFTIMLIQQRGVVLLQCCGVQCCALYLCL